MFVARFYAITHFVLYLLLYLHRYMNRRGMVDSAGMIKETVNQCNELWDTTFQKIQAVVKRLKHTCQVHTICIIIQLISFPTPAIWCS